MLLGEESCPILIFYRIPASQQFSALLGCILYFTMSQIFSHGKRSGMKAGHFITFTLLLQNHDVC